MPYFKHIVKNFLKTKQIGVAIRAKNFPGTPRCDELDFLISRHNFATSMGEVFKDENLSQIFSLGGKTGGGLFAP